MFYIIKIYGNECANDIFANSNLTIKDVFKKISENGFKEIRIDQKMHSLLSCHFCENLQKCKIERNDCDFYSFYFLAKIEAKINHNNYELAENLAIHMNVLTNPMHEKNYIVEV